MSQPVRVAELDVAAEATWDAYVASHSEGTFFHTLTWREAVSDAFGHRHVYLAAWRGEQLCGVFPLSRITSHLAGTLLVSVPYAVYGGALADDAEAAEALIDYAGRLAERMHAQWLDIRSVRASWDHLPVLTRYVTFRKQLPEDPAEVLGSMPRKARAAARAARERFGLQVEFDDCHLDTVWRLYSRNMRKLASPNYPWQFFESLTRRTARIDSRESITAETPAHLVQVITHEGRPIAGLLSFVYRGTLMPYFAGCDERCERYHPNNFLYLTLMERGAELGCSAFDFGRTRVDNAGAYNFKRFQGFEPTPLEYQYLVPQGGREPDLHPGNPRVALARRMWPRLPLAVTRPLGAWLAKSIPG